MLSAKTINKTRTLSALPTPAAPASPRTSLASSSSSSSAQSPGPSTPVRPAARVRRRPRDPFSSPPSNGTIVASTPQAPARQRIKKLQPGHSPDNWNFLSKGQITCEYYGNPNDLYDHALDHDVVGVQAFLADAAAPVSSAWQNLCSLPAVSYVSHFCPETGVTRKFYVTIGMFCKVLPDAAYCRRGADGHMELSATDAANCSRDARFVTRPSIFEGSGFTQITRGDLVMRMTVHTEYEMRHNILPEEVDIDEEELGVAEENLGEGEHGPDFYVDALVDRIGKDMLHHSSGLVAVYNLPYDCRAANVTKTGSMAPSLVLVDPEHNWYMRVNDSFFHFLELEVDMDPQSPPRVGTNIHLSRYCNHPRIHPRYTDGDGDEWTEGILFNTLPWVSAVLNQDRIGCPGLALRLATIGDMDSRDGFMRMFEPLPCLEKRAHFTRISDTHLTSAYWMVRTNTNLMYSQLSIDQEAWSQLLFGVSCKELLEKMFCHSTIEYNEHQPRGNMVDWFEDRLKFMEEACQVEHDLFGVAVLVDVIYSYTGKERSICAQQMRAESWHRPTNPLFEGHGSVPGKRLPANKKCALVVEALTNGYGEFITPHTEEQMEFYPVLNADDDEDPEAFQFILRPKFGETFPEGGFMNLVEEDEQTEEEEEEEEEKEPSAKRRKVTQVRRVPEGVPGHGRVLRDEYEELREHEEAAAIDVWLSGLDAHNFPVDMSQDPYEDVDVISVSKIHTSV